MKYIVNHITETLEPYYFGPGKSDPTQTFRSEIRDTYAISSEETFEKLISDITDFCDFDLTEENIEKWWGAPEGKISKEKFERISSYYRGRNSLKERILSETDSFRKGTGKIFTGTYDVPEESRCLVLEDNKEYEPMISKESIWVTMERN